jgi:HAMP domain-containing protein
MLKWMYSKIGVKLLITFSVVLVLSMGSLIYIATTLVAGFGEFSTSMSEKSIRNNAKDLLARITHEQAMRYESTFKKFAASSSMIAKQAAFFLEHMALYGKKPLNPDEKLVIQPQNGIFSNDRSEKTMVLYWGSPFISPGIREQINTLSHLDPLLEIVKEGNPESVACYVVTEPGIARYCPNIHGVEKLPPTTKFDIRNANWYVIAKPENNLERKTVWSNIYLDSVGQGLLTTASTPFYSKSGEYLGAAGVDITLDTIVKDILSHIPSCHRMEGLVSFLVDNQGRLIAVPPEYLDLFEIKIDRDKLVDATVILKHSLLDSSNLEIRKIGESMLEKKYEVSGFILNGQPYIISSHFMPSTGWRLGVVVPESVILASVQETRDILDLTVKKMTGTFSLVTVFFLIVSIIVIAIFSIKSVIRPLDKLSRGALRVKEGDLATHVDIHTKDEIGSLAQSFNNMVDNLRDARDREKEYTQTLEQKVEDRTREITIKNEELKNTLQVRKQAEEALQRERDKLQDALSEVKTLQGILPICSYCKKIRDDQGYWQKVEKYVHDRSGAEFSHGVCPECAKKHWGDYLDAEE